MTCVICKTGQTQPGTTQTTLARDGTTVVTNGVPADVCDNCGEAYLSATTTEQLHDALTRAIDEHVSVSVCEFQTA